ncbi:Putative restriction endonuclease [Nonomuraea maritima]|jgi:Uma2 family endonuclease|uniref:Putative restriction endonuclease n=1 Tax=Nonomuraea maritima TaxID=683260 RepID=A0A1G8VG15_9ACTN|nr:Uma2 family endonuclease [Nonomuraea maritima]SDJ64834.1 Putative restriction endonuclease [Nonomuraea maritima]
MAGPLEERFRTVRDLLPDYRVETTGGRIVVNESGTWQHNTIVFRLIRLLIGTVVDRGWEIWPNITVCTGGVDRYVPDLVVVPRSPLMRFDHAVQGDSTLLVADVVSADSAYDDHYVKPCGYAPAGVPLYLVLDPFQGAATLFGEPSGGKYRSETVAAAGEPLVLPAPWDRAVDTAALW